MNLEKLINIYEERLHDINLDSEESLVETFKQDERLFYFALMYFYLTKRELSKSIFINPIIAVGTTLFCMSAKNATINQYFSRFINLQEIPEQIVKITSELKLIGEQQ